MRSSSVSTSTKHLSQGAPGLTGSRRSGRRSGAQRHTVDLIVAAPLLDVPVLLVEEQLVDASALAFLEEAEATDLAAEYMELVRYGFMSSPASSERMREVIQRRHVLRQKGRGRKKKKKRKKRLPQSSRPRLPRTAWFFSGYMFLPRSRRLLGTISALFQREGGPWLLRSILAVTCGFLGRFPHFFSVKVDLGS